MDGVPAKKVARDLGITFEQLQKLLAEAGTEISSEDDPLAGNVQLQALLLLRAKNKDELPDEDVKLSDIELAEDLRELNRLLTRAMAQRNIQALIKDRNLDTVVERVVYLTLDPDDELLAAAILGRLAAVARGRQNAIFDRVSEVFSDEPGSIETLPDGEAKEYAANVLTHVDAPWIGEYVCREAIAIESANNARRELLSSSLARAESISGWLDAVAAHSDVLRAVENDDTRLRRVRRIAAAMADIVHSWRGEVGTDAGARLAACMKTLLAGKLAGVDQDVLFETLDNLLSILRRIIELRFSTALYAKTYDILEEGKKLVGPGIWARFIERSEVIPEIRVALLETALVLARQNRQYKEILFCLMACYASRPQVAAAIKRHFGDARDLDPDVAEWWRTAGSESAGQRHVEHKVGNNEDSQIGALLIEVDSNRDAMEKVGRAVVPLLEISEPVLASTVKKAVDGYQSIAQTARRLARMRKLTKTDLQGERLEYNPLEHEMLGGHEPGVRRVKVVRDGIQKDFAGKRKTLVKPWVEPDEE